MKLSSLTTDEVTDVLCEITPHIASITSDKDLLNILGDTVKGGSVAEIVTIGIKKISSIAPILLKTHKNDVFEILSVLNKTTVDVIRKQNIMKTMRQIKEVVQDKELVDFFKLWQQVDNIE